MTQEDKELLLQDICARLPYGVKIDREWIAPMSGSLEHSIIEFDTFDIDVIKTSIELGEEGDYREGKMQGLTICDDGKNHFVRGYMCKPYLRPMSSMTDEERSELPIQGFDADCEGYIKNGWMYSDAEKCNFEINIDNIMWLICWLNAHHFDYRGLIEKGLAIAVTKENNPYK